MKRLRSQYFSATWRQFVAVAVLSASVWAVGTESAHPAVPDLKGLYPTGIQQGKSIDVTIIGKADRKDQFWCSRNDVKFAWHADEKKKNVLQVTASADTPPGIVWMRAYNAEGTSALRPFAVGRLAEVNEAEPNDEIGQVKQLADVPTIFNGTINRGTGVDMFGVSLKKGETVVADVDAHIEFGSPIDIVLQLVSSDGFVLEQNHDGPNLDPKLVYTSEKDGNYYLRMFGFPSAPNQAITFFGDSRNIYRLLVTKSAYVEQVYPAAVQLGQPTTVRFQGWNIAEVNCQASVIGDVLDKPVQLQLPEFANSKEIPVVEHASVIEEDLKKEDGKPMALTLPVTVTGRIDKPGDEDQYQFEMKKGQKVVVNVESHALGTFMDTKLKVVRPDGKALYDADTRTSGVFDEKTTLTANMDGLHTLHLSDLFRHGGRDFVYRLTLTPPEVACRLKVKEGAFTLKPDAPLEIEVTIERENGYAKNVEVQAIGLPEGVTAEAVTSDNNGDTKGKVKLVLKSAADQKAIQGTFQIVGRIEGEADRWAEATIAGFKETSDRHWLTVMKAVEKPAEKKDENAEAKK